MTLTTATGKPTQETTTHMQGEKQRHENQLDKETIWRKRRRPR